jgi:voltage-gated potassium channel
VKFATAMLTMLAAPTGQHSVRALVRLLAVFTIAVLLFSVGFHALMELEGREHSWPTSIYWTIVTMSTLGFGDITFESDLGRMYSIVVLLTGSLIILILLPFTFIQFVYVPWREALRRARTPRELPEQTSGHLVLTGRDPVEEVLIARARAAGVPYVLVVEDLEQAIALSDDGYDVLVGALDDPETYRNARVDAAALVVAGRGDTTNTNVAFTVREVSGRPKIVVTANSPDSVDVLQLAGADEVLQLGRLLGESFADRILSPHARSSVVDRFQDLVMAEAAAAHTSLVGRTIGELDLRERVGISIVGVWNRGRFEVTRPELEIEESSILVLAGTEDQLRAYDELYVAPSPHNPPDPNADGVIVIGGGRVGRAVAAKLAAAGTRCTIVERLPERVREEYDYVLGDAADIEVLRAAGIDTASAVVVTTHDDDTNVYLTLYCRRLRPDVQLLGRVALDRNVSTMHRAGADFVLSYASAGATVAWNVLRDDSTLLLAEGLVVFRVPMPDRLAGKALRDTEVARTTGCTVIGLGQDGTCSTRMLPETVLPEEAELILIGSEEAEQRFLSRYVAGNGDGWWRRTRARVRPS